MEIKLVIEAPGLAEAMTVLAAAIQGNTELLLQTYSRPDMLAQNVTPIRPEPEPTPPETQATQPEAPTQEPESSNQVITLEQIRALATEKAKAGKDLKSLITQFGASKLTEIPEEKYPEFLAKVEGL